MKPWASLLTRAHSVRNPAPVSLAEPMPPRPQFADLDRLARYQATRRAFAVRAEADRIAAQIVAHTRGDADAMWIKRAAFVDALDAALEAERNRDVAQDVRRAGA
jgi:hypothetical protein